MIIHANALVQVDDKSTLHELQTALDAIGALSLRVIRCTGEGFGRLTVSLHMEGGRRFWGEGDSLVEAVNGALRMFWEDARTRDAQEAGAAQ
jgi:hypothetical protein